MPNLLRHFAGAAIGSLEFMLRKLSPNDVSWLARNAVLDRKKPGSRVLAQFGYQAHMSWENAQYDVRLNGESELLERMAAFSPAVLFDVGANVGDWSIAAAAVNSAATIHAFEIMDPTYAKLTKGLAGLGERVVANNFGLFDKAGEITIYFAEASDVHSSVFAESHNVVGNTKVVARQRPVVTGDDYMKSQSIAHIDLLKIDVEGAELQVLAGFQNALAEGRVDVLQFEYGKCSLVARTFLKDFFSFFEPRGYVLGKMLPDGIDFCDYDIGLEDFIGPNYVACKKNRQDIISALSLPAGSAYRSRVRAGEGTSGPL